MKSASDNRMSRRTSEPEGWTKIRVRNYQLEAVRLLADLQMILDAEQAAQEGRSLAHAPSVADNHVVWDALESLLKGHVQSAGGKGLEKLDEIQRHFSRAPRITHEFTPPTVPPTMES